MKNSRPPQKKLLLISYNFTPSQTASAERPFFIVKNLEGVDVDVYTSGNVDGAFGFRNDYQANDFKGWNLQPEAPKINLLNDRKGSTKFIVRFGSFLQRFIPIDKGTFWVLKDWLKLLNLVKKGEYDYVYTTGPPFSVHFFGLFCTLRTNVKWFCEFRDYYYLNQFNRKFSLNAIFSKLSEFFFVKYSYKIVVVSDAFKRAFLKHYDFLKNEEVFVMYNGFSAPGGEKVLFHHERVKDRPIKILYSGTFYSGARSPMPLLLAIENLVIQGHFSPSDFSIEIAGRIEDQFLFKELGLKISDSIVLLGKLERQILFKKQKEADYLWFIVNEYAHQIDGLPIKGFEYLKAGKPILVFSSEEDCVATDVIVKEFSAGVYFSDSFDSKDIEINSHKLLKLISSEKEKKVLNISKYSRIHQTWLLNEELLKD